MDARYQLLPEAKRLSKNQMRTKTNLLCTQELINNDLDITIFVCLKEHPMECKAVFHAGNFDYANYGSVDLILLRMESAFERTFLD